MDALVFVSRGSIGSWDVYAREPKGIDLGTIRESEDSTVIVVARRGSPLKSLQRREYANLDAAMAAIASHLNGTCRKWTP
jgi:hypothetical protein